MINNFEPVLLLWQFFLIIALITIAYFVIKLYRRIVKYLDTKNNSQL